MTRRFWSNALALVAFLATCGPAVAQLARPAEPAGRVVLADRIVAIVNKDVITMQELQERTERVSLQLRRQGAPLPPADVLQRQVLERMITDLVQVQFAKESGVSISEADLDRTLARIAQQNNLAPAAFRQAVEREGMDWARFRDDIRSEMLISRLREREVDSKIQVSDGEVDAFLEDNRAGPDASPEYDLSHILVRVPEQAGPEQIEARRRRAEEALAQIRGGVDFRQVAVTYSDAPDALQGGGMGWRSADRLPEIFVNTLASMRPGEVSEILRSPAGFHILRMNDRRGGAAAAAVPQSHVRHILVRTNELVSESDALRKLNILRERIRQGADFGELARLNSDDASAARGGDLGWVTGGDLEPTFEHAMNALKIGEVSEPVRTPFGYHLIQVLERRMADLPDERKRLQARRVLGERRADEAYQEWVRQLRDRAYVENRLEER
ncbi:MAG: peptidylprolyl isomerase [Burkholderiales bacterium]|nr:peptidylprolyl isomerase [Burkholderiales bacterium]